MIDKIDKIRRRRFKTRSKISLVIKNKYMYTANLYIYIHDSTVIKNKEVRAF